jgi:hypothetical protein
LITERLSIKKKGGDEKQKKQEQPGTKRQYRS